MAEHKFRAEMPAQLMLGSNDVGKLTIARVEVESTIKALRRFESVAIYNSSNRTKRKPSRMLLQRQPCSAQHSNRPMLPSEE